MLSWVIVFTYIHGLRKFKYYQRGFIFEIRLLIIAR